MNIKTMRLFEGGHLKLVLCKRNTVRVPHNHAPLDNDDGTVDVYSPPDSEAAPEVAVEFKIGEADNGILLDADNEALVLSPGHWSIRYTTEYPETDDGVCLDERRSFHICKVDWENE